MSQSFFIGDLHLGDKNITNHRKCRKGLTIPSDEHDMYVMEHILSTVGRRDKLNILGDVCFTETAFRQYFKVLHTYIPNIALWLGNHEADKPVDIRKYHDLGIKLYGTTYHKRFVVGHIPVHRSQFRKAKANIHAHTHSVSLNDPDYLCVSVDSDICNFKPVSLQVLNEIFESRKNK